MIEAVIADVDIIVVRQQAVADNGDARRGSHRQAVPDPRQARQTRSPQPALPSAARR